MGVLGNIRVEGERVKKVTLQQNLTHGEVQNAEPQSFLSLVQCDPGKVRFPESGTRYRRQHTLTGISVWTTDLQHKHSFPHTLIPSYTHTLIHSFPHTLIPSFPHTLIPSYTHSLIHSFPQFHSFTMSIAHTCTYNSYKHTNIEQ